MSSQTETLQLKVANLVQMLGYEASIQIDEMEIEGRNYFDIKIDVEEPGELIGRHGSFIDAIATVIGMFVPRVEGQRYSVLVDVNGYRAERGKYLQDMAVKAMDDAISTGEQVELQPMKPWERRLVHMAAVGRTDIITESQGEEPDRRIVIKPAA